MTAGFVGADLANIINEAALLGVRQDKDKVGIAELQEAVERVVAGLEKKNRVLSPEEKKRVAYHELGHALVATALPGNDNVHKISIIPRGVAALGYTMQLPTEDRFLMTESELENKVAMLLGGRAAEELIFDEVSTGRARRPQQGDRHRAQHGQDLRHEPAPGAGQPGEGSARADAAITDRDARRASNTASKPPGRSTTRSAGSSTSNANASRRSWRAGVRCWCGPRSCCWPRRRSPARSCAT